MGQEILLVCVLSTENGETLQFANRLKINQISFENFLGYFLSNTREFRALFSSEMEQFEISKVHSDDHHLI